MMSLTIQLPQDAAFRLDALAHKLALTSDAIALQAIEDFVSRQTWQLEEIEAGLAEVEAGDFASATEVQDFLLPFSNLSPKQNNV